MWLLAQARAGPSGERVMDEIDETELIKGPESGAVVDGAKNGVKRTVEAVAAQVLS